MEKIYEFDPVIYPYKIWIANCCEKVKNMKVIIEYKSIDPYYSDQTQTFVGENMELIDNQIYEFKQYLGREHPSGISFIYRPRIIHVND